MNLPVFDLHCDTALELLDSQTQEAGRYQPEEAERLNNAVFATYGTCVVLCVTSDTDTANAVIKEYVG